MNPGEKYVGDAAGVRVGEDKPSSSFLCFAWGESDLPAAVIATSRAEVLQFMVDEWFGERPEAMCDSNLEQWNSAVAEFDTHDWREDGPLKWTFEIGGVEIKKVASAVPSVEPKLKRLLEVMECDDLDDAIAQAEFDVQESLAAARFIKTAKNLPENEWPSVHDRRLYLALEAHLLAKLASAPSHVAPTEPEYPPAVSATGTQDAARYRWLRDEASWLGFQWRDAALSPPPTKERSFNNQSKPADIDAAIDAAMRGTMDGGTKEKT